MRALSIIGASLTALSLAACAGTPPVEFRDREVIREVPVPFREPCPNEGQVPTLPNRVAAEHPTMPADPGERERILGAKVAELQGYAATADAIMRTCSTLPDSE